MIFGKVLDFEFDPFQPDLRLSLRDKYLLSKLMQDFKISAAERVIKYIDATESMIMRFKQIHGTMMFNDAGYNSEKYGPEISEISFLNYNESGVMEALMDCRSAQFRNKTLK